MADKWKDVRKGWEKFFRLLPYFYAVWVLLGILPHLPDELAKRIVDALLKKLGI